MPTIPDFNRSYLENLARDMKADDWIGKTTNRLGDLSSKINSLEEIEKNLEGIVKEVEANNKEKLFPKVRNAWNHVFGLLNLADRELLVVRQSLREARSQVIREKYSSVVIDKCKEFGGKKTGNKIKDLSSRLSQLEKSKTELDNIVQKIKETRQKLGSRFWQMWDLEQVNKEIKILESQIKRTASQLETALKNASEYKPMNELRSVILADLDELGITNATINEMRKQLKSDMEQDDTVPVGLMEVASFYRSEDFQMWSKSFREDLAAQKTPFMQLTRMNHHLHLLEDLYAKQLGEKGEDKIKQDKIKQRVAEEGAKAILDIENLKRLALLSLIESDINRDIFDVMKSMSEREFREEVWEGAIGGIGGALGGIDQAMRDLKKATSQPNVAE